MIVLRISVHVENSSLNGHNRKLAVSWGSCLSKNSTPGLDSPHSMFSQGQKHFLPTKSESLKLARHSKILLHLKAALSSSACPYHCTPHEGSSRAGRAPLGGILDYRY